MRPVLIDDLLLLAAYLEAVAPRARRVAVHVLCDRAHVADCQRKRLGRSGSDWGNGSLNAAVNAGTRVARASGERGVSAGVGSVAHLLALSAALEGVLGWKQGQAVRGGQCPEVAGRIAEPAPAPYSRRVAEREARHG